MVIQLSIHLKALYPPETNFLNASIKIKVEEMQKIVHIQECLKVCSSMKTYPYDRVEIPPAIRKREQKRLGLNPTFRSISFQSLIGFVTGLFLLSSGIFMTLLPFFVPFATALGTALVTIAGCFSFLLGAFWIYQSVSSKHSVSQLTRDAVHRIVRDQN